MMYDMWKHIGLSLTVGGVLLIGLFLLSNGAPLAVHADPGALFASPAGSGSDCTRIHP